MRLNYLFKTLIFSFVSSEPVTKIIGGADRHVNLGSTVNLTCLVLYHAKPPDVTWLHQGVVSINYKLLYSVLTFKECPGSKEQK